MWSPTTEFGNSQYRCSNPLYPESKTLCNCKLFEIKKFSDGTIAVICRDCDFEVNISQVVNGSP